MDGFEHLFVLPYGLLLTLLNDAQLLEVGHALAVAETEVASASLWWEAMLYIWIMIFVFKRACYS